MDKNTRKEEFSYGYIQTIVATAGFSVHVKSRSMDAAGIDITIETPGDLANSVVGYPKIDAQVKCTSTGATYVGSDITFPLRVKNYNKLIQTNVLVPQILVLVIVPNDLEDWIEVIEPRWMIVRKCCYWLSLKGQGKTTNAQNVTVTIPRSNLLTPKSLVELMNKVAKGQDL